MENVLAKSSTFVGCGEHEKNMTKSIINYFCIARTKILCKNYNKIHNDVRKEEQKYRKLSKLIRKNDSLDKSSQKRIPCERKITEKSKPKKTKSFCEN